MKSDMESLITISIPLWICNPIESSPRCRATVYRPNGEELPVLVKHQRVKRPCHKRSMISAASAAMPAAGWCATQPEVEVRWFTSGRQKIETSGELNFFVWKLSMNISRLHFHRGSLFNSTTGADLENNLVLVFSHSQVFNFCPVTMVK